METIQKHTTVKTGLIVFLAGAVPCMITAALLVRGLEPQQPPVESSGLQPGQFGDAARYEGFEKALDRIEAQVQDLHMALASRQAQREPVEDSSTTDNGTEILARLDSLERSLESLRMAQGGALERPIPRCEFRKVWPGVFRKVWPVLSRLAPPGFCQVGYSRELSTCQPGSPAS